MAFDFVGEGVGVEHNSAQNFLREEFQGHHTNEAYYKSGIISPEYEANPILPRFKSIPLL
jgi:hypothetical protein